MKELEKKVTTDSIEAVTQLSKETADWELHLLLQNLEQLHGRLALYQLPKRSRVAK